LKGGLQRSRRASSRKTRIETPTLADARSAGLFHPDCTHNIATAMTFESEIAKAKYRADPERKAKAALAEGERFWSRIDDFGRASIINYTDRDINSEINNYLYNNAPASEEIRAMATQIEEALQQASLPEDTILYRGVNPDIWQIMKADLGYVTSGDEVSLKGFLSSTYDQASAWKYASENASKDDEIAVIEILAPKGTQAAAIEEHSLAPHDKEILINCNTKFKVIEARKDGNVMRLI